MQPASVTARPASKISRSLFDGIADVVSDFFVPELLADDARHRLLGPYRQLGFAIAEILDGYK